MKQFLLILLSLSFFVSSLLAQDPSYSIFDDSYLHEIRITFDEADFWDIITHNYESASTGSEVPYLAGDIVIDGYSMSDIGVRQKGFASNFFVFGTKKPLKLDFNEFVSGQEFSGITKINLGNGVGDPSIVKDKLAYDIMRFHGIPAPRVSHAKVYLNNTLWGIYALIEQVDKRYLERNFADASGNLYKSMDNTELHWAGPERADYPEMDLKTNETEDDWSNFIHFIDVINNVSDANFRDSIDAIFEVDAYLRTLAIDILANNWDSYIDHGRNFYIYHQPKTGKFQWIPWDYNFSFDRGQFGSDDLDLVGTNSDKVLTYRIMQVPEFEQRFYYYMCQLLELNFTEERITEFVDDHYAIVNQNWDDASNNLFNSTQVFNSLYSNWFGDFSQTQGILNYLDNRTVGLESDLINAGYTCLATPSVMAENTVVLNELYAVNDSTLGVQDPAGQLEDWIELYNNTDQVIIMENYFLSDDPEFPKKWRMPNGSYVLPNEYQIVWADRDIHQEGLHTSFKMEKSGESLLFTYIDGTVVDEIAFPIQTADQSYSRIPNGTGPFDYADITHGAENSKITAIRDIPEIDIVSVFPNPTSDYFTLESSIEFTDLVITDAIGNLLYNYSGSSTDFHSIDASNWNSGIYLIQIKAMDKQFSELILIH